MSGENPQGSDKQPAGFAGGRRTAYRIAAGQFAIAALCAAGFGLALGPRGGASALVGGTINALANFYLARRVFGGDTSPRAILSNLYIGEFIKIALTAALFLIAIMTMDLEFLPLIVGYVATLLGFWVALLRTVNR